MPEKPFGASKNLLAVYKCICPERWKNLTIRKVVRRLLDTWHDYRCTRSMGFAFGLFSTRFHSGHDMLQDLFKRLEVHDDDVFVDVGCGKGRVIAFLASMFPKNRIIGIELADTAVFAKRVFAKNGNVDIRQSDIKTGYPQTGTIFYIFPPLGGGLLRALKKLVDQRATKQTRIVTYGSLGTIDDFLADNTWNVQRLLPPQSWCRRFTSTYWIYQIDRRPDCFYGVILTKRV